ncbi:MAG: type II toxin-antitoxin system RelE/ParE family toxin [Gammaproteobacteria bacterium]|nr:MAG: type II toxin-antitoxin system RelE/ParE family toxin [Gammaproteobacteria bacterium]
MVWRYASEFSAEAERDFGLILDHLFESYQGFGEPMEAAMRHAGQRVMEIRRAAGRLETAPHRGTSRDDLLSGLRFLALDGAVLWFEVDDDNRKVRVLAVFFGGQDHIRHMLVRLLR